ncbi:MAG: TIR domain-containing protein [Cellulosilyticaceae bacterium]
MQDVFISYSSRNREVAEKICIVLEQEGIKCWIAPRNITAGKEWGEEIIKGIETSKVLLLVFSEASNESTQVLREVERAVSKRLSIVNFRIENIEPTKSMEYFLYTNHWVEAHEGKVDEYIQALSETLKPLLEAYEDRGCETGESMHKSVHQTYAKKNKYRKWLKIASGVGITAAVIAALISLNAIRVKVERINEENGQIAQGGEGSQGDVVPTIGEEQEENKENTHTETVDSTLKDTEGSQIQQKDPSDVQETDKTNDTETPSNNHADKTPTQVEPEIKNDKNTSVQVEETQRLALEVGDYIRFGTYQGAPIDWIVIRVKENGSPLLIAKEILTLKSFDAAESGKWGESSTGEKFDVHKPKESVYTDYTAQTLREMKGSNHWGSSNMRTWLNSDSRKVAYSDTAPIKEAVSGKLNDYYKEAGFLSEFTSSEKDRIQNTTYKSVLAEADASKKKAGSEVFGFKKAAIKESISNSSNAYYEELTDKVFLLSVEELIAYMEDEYIEIKTTLTEEAIANDKSGWYKDLKGQTGGYHMWWLRTPAGQSASEVCAVGTKGDVVYTEYATSSGVGVRPAVYIDVKDAEVEGSGSEQLPYIIK